MLDQLEKKAGDYLEQFGSCAQATLLALQDGFDFRDSQTLRAATAMPGIALRGETCGAVAGALMALGIAFGREEPEDYQALERTLAAARSLCRRFEKEFGSCMCTAVQVHLFGRSFDLVDPVEMEEFVEAGAVKKCRTPVEKAARTAGEIILDGMRREEEEG